ncbi:polynucleotide kinase 3-phosphatase-like [hydrothermal vent metagenome]|uniref:Polynucleotide kinase 3-phosphatase-like n=1 Tax=hydrothermal vent metagenome TaxID=652676 RepID=A0A3B0XVF2_9ZZZZ
MNGVIFIGLQASGKSSFYFSNLFKTHIRLSLDMLKTRHRENLLFNACLESKQPCVIDNTNPTKKDREKYISQFKKHKFNVTGYYFSSRLSDCIARNALREGKECIPVVGIKDTYNKLEIPHCNEGFDGLYYVSIKDGCFKIEEWTHEIQ